MFLRVSKPEGFPSRCRNEELSGVLSWEIDIRSGMRTNGAGAHLETKTHRQDGYYDSLVPH